MCTAYVTDKSEHKEANAIQESISLKVNKGA